MAKLRPASYKGKKFNLAEPSNSEHGRRNILHEYPFRDIPYSEDLGRSARVFSVIAGFMDKSDALAFIELLEEPGPGKLIHPWYGSVVAMLKMPAKISWPKFDGGLITIDISFVEAGENTEPDTQVDDLFNLNAIADLLQQKLDGIFPQNWMDALDKLNDLDSVMDSVSALFDVFEQFLSPWQRALSRIERAFSSIAGLFNNPAKLLDTLKGMFGRLGSLGNLISGSSSFPDSNWQSLVDGSIFEDPSIYYQKDENNIPSVNPSLPLGQNPLSYLPAELKDYVSLSLLIEVCRNLPELEFQNQTDLDEGRNTLVDAFTPHLMTASDELYPIIKDLMIQSVQVLDKQINAVDTVSTIYVQAVLSALLIDYQYGGSIDNYDDILMRNNITHPLFIPPGKVQVIDVR